MTRISNLLLGATAGAVATLVLQSAPSSAATLTIASTVDASSSTGLSLSGGGNFLSTDVFSLNASGTPNFNTNDSYITNAAGVLTQPYSGASLPTGSSFAGPNSATAGALLIGNNSIGYFQLFPTNATNGAGSSNPPTSFSFSNITLGSIFGTALDNTPTSTLFLIANDSVYTDNSGTFSVSGSIDPATSVPEPFTVIGTLVGGTAAFRMKKKLQEVNK